MANVVKGDKMQPVTQWLEWEANPSYNREVVTLEIPIGYSFDNGTALVLDKTKGAHVMFKTGAAVESPAILMEDVKNDATTTINKEVVVLMRGPAILDEDGVKFHPSVTASEKTSFFNVLGTAATIALR